MTRPAADTRTRRSRGAVDAGALVAESNHRIANNLSVIAGMVRLYASQISSRQTTTSSRRVRLMLEEIAVRIDTVGRLHRLLSDERAGEEFEIADYLREITSAVSDSLSFAGRMEVSHAFATGCWVRPEQAISIGLIVSEAITNSIKYGQPTGRMVKITVGCHCPKPGLVAIDVADDGVGLPRGFDPRRSGGLGFRLIRSFARQLGAELRFERGDPGLRFHMFVPTASAPRKRRR